MRFFNTEGPVRSQDHYCLPPLRRWNLEEVLELIDRKKYFLLHAPRQTGKTTCLLALMAHLNREGRYRTLYANIEGAQNAREDVDRGMAAICSVLGRSARLYPRDFPAAPVAGRLQSTPAPFPAVGDSVRGARSTRLSNSRLLRTESDHRRQRLQYQGGIAPIWLNADVCAMGP